MRIFSTIALVMITGLPALADFSYTTDMKPLNVTIRHYYKGQKMMADMGSLVSILDFDTQTVTTIDKSKKTYTVKPFSEFGQAVQRSGMETTIDVKETGAHKTINGFNAAEIVMTMAIDTPQSGRAGIQMQVEMDSWLSPDVPGASEVHAFYKRNAEQFPWTALATGANPSMQRGMAEAQRKMANMAGVPVLQVITTKSSGAHAMTPEQSARMEQSRERMEAMAKSGGLQATIAQQALKKMQGISGTGFTMTMESSGFSTEAVADSVFAIPAGFEKH